MEMSLVHFVERRWKLSYICSCTVKLLCWFGLRFLIGWTSPLAFPRIYFLFFIACWWLEVSKLGLACVWLVRLWFRTYGDAVIRCCLIMVVERLRILLKQSRFHHGSGGWVVQLLHIVCFMNGEWNCACAFCDNSFGLFQVVSGCFLSY
jgi:hypothetical protein